MKETCWNDCLNSNSAKIITPDKHRSKSLKETAIERINLITHVDERNCNFIFEDYYTSILELLQAMAFEKGFNIQNHICVGFYIKEVLKKDDMYKIFDDLRYKRNSLTYYGNRMDFETAKQAIKNCKVIMRELTT